MAKKTDTKKMIITGTIAILALVAGMIIEGKFAVVSKYLPTSAE